MAKEIMRARPFLFLNKDVLLQPTWRIEMEIVKVILLSVALVAIAMFGLAVRILLLKGGKFPNTHVSGNKFLKRNGIYCAQTQDKLARREAQKKVKFDKLTFVPDNK